MISTEKIIINFCPTGMIPTRSMTPFVPVSPNEIIEQTHEAFELGITIAHLHARDENETPTWDPKIYSVIFEGIRKHCPEVIICGSTSGRNFPEFEKRSAVIELKPDMCSLTLGSMNFSDTASMNSPDMILALAQKMNEYGVHPELECFDLGMINFGKYLIKKKILKDPLYWNIILGNIQGLQATTEHFEIALRDLPSTNNWISFGGIGNFQRPVNEAAIEKNYGVRVGLEDNIWLDSNRSTKASNIQLVQRIHQVIRKNEKEFMTGKELGNLGFYNGK